MANNRFVFTGLEELKADLRRLPADLTDEASAIVFGAGNGAADVIQAGYKAHRHSGDLADHVTVTVRAGGRFGVAVVVRSAGRAASVFETGSQARHYVTRKGVRHLTGKMPATPTFVPAVRRARRAMYAQLRALLVAHGLQVTGDA
jgi:hypothetical protein